MKISIKALLFLVLPFQLSAFAQDSPFNYNYLQAGYSTGTVTVSSASYNTSSASIGGSIATSESTFVLGNFSNGTLTVGTASVNLDSSTIGFGGHMSLSEKTDLVGSLSYLSSTMSYNGSWVTTTGYGFDGGIKHAVSDKVELVAGAGLSITGDDRVQTTNISLGTRFKVSNSFSLGAGYVNARNTTASSRGFGVSGRVEF
jgi:hypothetical protein